MTDGYHVYYAETDDRAIEDSAYYRFNMVLHDITLIYTADDVPKRFKQLQETDSAKLPQECYVWLKECIDTLIAEYAEKNLQKIEENNREFMIAFEKQLEFERQRTEEIVDERNQ